MDATEVQKTYWFHDLRGEFTCTSIIHITEVTVFPAHHPVHWCCDPNAYVFPKCVCEILTFKGDDVSSRWGPFWGRLKHENGALMNTISALIKRAHRAQGHSTIWKHLGSLQPGKEPSPDHAGTPILVFQPPEPTVSITFLLFRSYPVCGVLL